MPRNHPRNDQSRRLRDLTSFAVPWFLCWVCTHSQAATVNFWLSNGNQGPAAPTIEVLPGTTSEIGIWARAAPGLNLTAFALNLVSETPSAITFEHIEVHNPLLGFFSGDFVYRHQLVFDSTISVPGPFGPVGINLQPALIEGFSGLTFFNDTDDLPSGGGIGPTCLGAFCNLDATGAPIWRIATVQYEAGAVGSSTNLFLEIGTKGIWHANEDPTATSARFGLPNDTLHEWAVLGDLDTDDHRNMHMGLPDAVINVVASITDADFDDDSDIDGADFITWQRGLGVGNTHAQGDANGNGQVNAADLAIWENQFGTAAASAIVSVPEPSTLLQVATVAAFLGWYKTQRRFNVGAGDSLLALESAIRSKSA